MTARTVATAKPGRHGDGGGLYLVVRPSGAGQWVFRFTSPSTKRVTEAGLGSADTVSLAEARILAFEARKSRQGGTRSDRGPARDDEGFPRKA
ncbi:MAG TPA: Arm DNA-binding domain-containing protein, partial [Methylocella sp.]